MIERIEKSREIFWDLVDVHIGAIPVASQIILQIKKLPSDVLGSCDFIDEISEDFYEVASVEINEDIYTDHTLTEEDRLDILLHEFAHLICGLEDDEFGGHSSNWESICKELGGNLKFY